MADDPPPVPPIRPDSSACCDTGCIPCVFDVYEEHLGEYQDALREWRGRNPAPAAAGLKIFSTLAVMGAMRPLGALYAATGGGAPDPEFEPTIALVSRIARGELADVAILTRDALLQLMADGLLLAASHVDVAVSRVGIAVRAGAPRPDISTVEALKAALLDARSVAYSGIGASGIFFAALLDRLGIEDAVNARAIITPGGFTAQRLVSGEAELAVQQLSELLVVPGIDIVGPMPAGAESMTIFSGAILTHSLRQEESRGFLRFLASPQAGALLQAAGLEAPGSH